MPSDRWKRVEAIFHAASTMPAPEQNSYISAQCGDDVDLRRDVESLLAAEASNAEFLPTCAAQLVGDAIEARAMAHEGRQIGNYRLTRLLGTGGMGSVWLAQRDDAQFEQQVAIKLIRQGLATDDTLRRFRQERQLLAHLSHPNIARLLDGSVTSEGSPYFIMEYVRGMPIDRWCDTQRLSISDRLSLFRRVCDAVTFAHQNLVVHRDLKPGNILIDSQGEPKLLDFGIAKVLGRDGAAPRDVTATAERRFTPAYASPELVRGDSITTATDIYSLGVILYELMSGHAPYLLNTTSAAQREHVICEQQPVRPSAALSQGSESASPEHVRQTLQSAEQIAGARRTDVRQLRRQLAGDIDTIVLSALRKEPQRRYASVEHMSQDIQRHLERLPVLARPDSISYRASMFVRRNAVAVSLSVIIAAGLIASTILSSVLYVQADSARMNAEHAESVAQRQRDIARRDVAKQWAVRAFLTQLLGDLQLVGADSTPPGVLEALDRRMAGFAQGSVRLEPDIEAAIRMAAGELYRWLDRPQQAIPQYEFAIRLVEPLADSHRDCAAALVMLGETNLELGRAEEAVKHLARSVDIQQHLGREASDILRARLSLINALLAVDRIDDAETQLMAAEPIAGDFNRHRANQLRDEIRAQRLNNER